MGMFFSRDARRALRALISRHSQSPAVAHPLSPPRAGGALFLQALTSVGTLVAASALFFEMRWEGNDDIAMAMVVHGYGIAAAPSPHLFFSNVLWGHLTQFLDIALMIPGYSLASLLTLSLAGTGLFLGLAHGRLPRALCAAAVVLIMLRPLLFQQFTINAGLVTIIAVVCAHHGARTGRRTTLYASCGLLFIAFLIRAPEACLVLAVALPLLPWAWLTTARHARVAIVTLVLALVAAQVIDYCAYQGPAWQAFSRLNPLRAMFTDFGARQAARDHPQLVRDHGYSANDMDLLGSWFFVDPNIADPKRLSALLASFGNAPLALDSLPLALRGMRNLWHPDLAPLFVAALLIGLRHGGRRVAASWILMLGAILVLGIVGRSGPVLRVYVPVLSLLVIAPLVWPRLHQRHPAVALTILLAAATVNSYRVISQSIEKQQQAISLRDDLSTLTNQPLVAWGATFPFELVYPVLGITPNIRELRFYGLGVFALAPFSVAHAEETAGNGFTARLRSEAGLRLVATKRQVSLLATYCREHLGSQLESLPAPSHSSLLVSQKRCVGTDIAPTTAR